MTTRAYKPRQSLLMTEQNPVEISFMRSRVLTWISSVIVLVLIIARGNPSLDTNSVADLVGYCVGAAILAYIFKSIAHALLKNRVKGESRDLYWNIGIIAYAVFFTLVWGALGY